MPAPGGVPALGEGVPAPGGIWSRGSGPRGAPTPWGSGLVPGGWGCLLQEGCLLPGGLVQGGACSWGLQAHTQGGN